MSKNAWSFGCRFVAAAALAIGASCAVTGTAAANDGGEARTGGCHKAASARSMGSTGPKGSAVAAGCRKRKKKDRRADHTNRRGHVNRPSYSQWQEQRRTQDILGRLLNVQSLNLNRASSGLPLADSFGFAASRGVTRQMAMRLDPTLRTVPGWSASNALSPLPAEGTVLAGRVVNAKDPQSALTAEVSTSMRTITETTSKVSRSDFGRLLSTADSGDLLSPASQMLGSATGSSPLAGLPALR